MKTFLFTVVLFLTISITNGQNNNLTIYKSGNGKQQIILISGLASKSEIWDQTINSLSKDATIYALDYYEDKNKTLTTIEQIVNQITHWIANKKIKKPTIIGHSLGGAIALDVASRIPKNIKKLVIVDSYPSLSALSNPNFVTNSKNDCSPFVKQFISMTDEQFENFQRTNLAQMTANKHEQDKLLDWIVKYDRSNYALLLCDYLKTDLREKIKLFDCPALILSSRGMKSFEGNIKNQYQGLKKSKILNSEMGLHFLMFDDFDWYISVVKDFIK